ncbi:MAG TPA: MerR family transcriptional regulator [Gemmatimonadales bacterium]|nr:MerR family transcriptional regulator [Gemmatimonadales bacterium]
MDLRIGEVVERTGIPASTLRYYESVGVLPSPKRVGGRRRYDPGVIQLLALLRFAREAGFTVAEMRTLLHGMQLEARPSERWAILTRQKLRELDEVISRAEAMKRLLEAGLRCGCLRLEDCEIVTGRLSLPEAAVRK